MGSSNHANVVKATLSALEQLRSREDRLRDRGFQIKPKAVAAVV
jgi:ribosomal protein S5